ncbi:MAG TPA: hypothetical protein PLD25_29820 [Chloroflexota bacterium]|nr:hypothetical protein [Chloroflexota bacterium]HUM67329.1 hypothetical protein [Chloroflexota bacterium]
MREVIQKWYEWLKQACPEPAEVATSPEKKEQAYVYSDGRQLWATDGYSLHARQVATEKHGHVTLDEAGLFQVSANGRLPDFAASLPQSQPAATIVVERDKLLQALAGQDRHVRLAFFTQGQTLELSSAGAYALVMPLVGLEEEDFWRPEIPDD